MRRLADTLGGHPVFSLVGRAMVPVDTVLHRATRGRLGLGALAGVRTLLLHTVGRRSGQPRTTPVLYVRHAGGYLVVGSNWGGAEHPGWSANLLANPAATVTVDGRDLAVRARLLTDTEREDLWPLLTRAWPAYDEYVVRAGGRRLRVFLLEPVDPV
ncbi:nitroreductase family deazaflavin-dependent oxidoreductase [Gandjariella thermophila]|nr:nitroreductase family deazaflavin-dependent oxidoreductase [Gandjariella thermophila]